MQKAKYLPPKSHYLASAITGIKTAKSNPINSDFLTSVTDMAKPPILVPDEVRYLPLPFLYPVPHIHNSEYSSQKLRPSPQAASVLIHIYADKTEVDSTPPLSPVLKHHKASALQNRNGHILKGYIENSCWLAGLKPPSGS